MHPIEPHLPALKRYAKSLCGKSGQTWLDHRDLVQEAVVRVLKADPPELTTPYFIAACLTAFRSALKQNKACGIIVGDEEIDDHCWVEPYDTEEMYEEELLFRWAESLITQRCPRGHNTKERDRQRRINYLKEYRKKKKHELQAKAA